MNIGATPLLRAAKAGDMPVMKPLLDPARWSTRQPCGHTPLIWRPGARAAALPTRGGNYTEDQAIEAVKLLLAAGANVNPSRIPESKTERGETLRCTGYVPIAGLLQGRNRHARRRAARLDQAGRSPARKPARIVDPVDADGKTPLDYAMGQVPAGLPGEAPAPQFKVAEALRALGSEGTRNAEAATACRPVPGQSWWPKYRHCVLT